MDPLARRVAARYIQSGYSGWDPPEYDEDPDPSEIWDALTDAFPASMQSLFARPKETKKHGYGKDLRVTKEVEFDLDPEFDLGGTITASAFRWTDADADGPYGESGVEGEYYLIAKNKTWDGASKKYAEDRFLQEFKRDVREFLNAIRADFPEVTAKYRL